MLTRNLVDEALLEDLQLLDKEEVFVVNVDARLKDAIRRTRAEISNAFANVGSFEVISSTPKRLASSDA